jgi:hypothetical protein
LGILPMLPLVASRLSEELLLKKILGAVLGGLLL